MFTHLVHVFLICHYICFRWYWKNCGGECRRLAHHLNLVSFQCHLRLCVYTPYRPRSACCLRIFIYIRTLVGTSTPPTTQVLEQFFDHAYEYYLCINAYVLSMSIDEWMPCCFRAMNLLSANLALIAPTCCLPRQQVDYSPPSPLPSPTLSPPSPATPPPLPATPLPLPFFLSFLPLSPPFPAYCGAVNAVFPACCQHPRPF